MKNKSIANQFINDDLTDITTAHAGVMQAFAHRMLQKFCDAALEKYGITKMQWLIIGTIQAAGPNGIRITDLADQLGTTLAYLTNTINLLESKNILTRVVNVDDNRAKLVSISPEYLTTCDEIEVYLRNKLRTSIYASVSQEDFHIYMKVLHQLSQIK